MFAELALDACLTFKRGTILDIGSGDGEQAARFRAAGFAVTTNSLRAPADVIGDYLQTEFPEPFDGIWASHVLEHQRNPGAFLDKCRSDLKDGGWLAVTVPPMKRQIVGGHVSVWNAGLLLDHLVLAGFACRHAAVRTYGYNVSAIVRKGPASLPPLAMDSGDIEKLSHLFPFDACQGFSGDIESLNWPPKE